MLRELQGNIAKQFNEIRGKKHKNKTETLTEIENTKREPSRSLELKKTVMEPKTATECSNSRPDQAEARAFEII